MNIYAHLSIYIQLYFPIRSADNIHMLTEVKFEHFLSV
jgi:hypothetical protein